MLPGTYRNALLIEQHAQVGRVAAGYGPDHLAEDPAAAVELLTGMLGPDTAVLVKGSRSAGLEAVASGLSQPGEAGGED